MFPFGMILSGGRPNYCSCTNSNPSQSEQADKLRGRQSLGWEQIEGLIKIHPVFSMLVFTVISSPPFPFLHRSENPSSPLTFPGFSIRKIAIVATLRHIWIILYVHYFLRRPLKHFVAKTLAIFIPHHSSSTEYKMDKADFQGFISHFPSFTCRLMHYFVCPTAVAN